MLSTGRIKETIQRSSEPFESRWRSLMESAPQVGPLCGSWVKLVVMTVADVEEKVQKKVMKRLEEMEGVVFLGMLTRGEKAGVTLLRTERVTLYMGGLVRKLLTKINGRCGGLDETERFRAGARLRKGAGGVCHEGARKREGVYTSYKKLENECQIF